MIQAPIKNLPASVRQRLLNLADKRGESFQYVLVQYGLERLLYRLSRSAHRDRFVLKGALPLPEIRQQIEAFLSPPGLAAAQWQSFHARWVPPGPWQTSGDLKSKP